MSVNTDLIAAKASIDTPTKWRSNPGLVAAVERATVEISERNAALGALRTAAAGVIPSYTDHSSIMALFDRAIAATSNPKGEP